MQMDKSGADTTRLDDACVYIYFLSIDALRDRWVVLSAARAFTALASGSVAATRATVQAPNMISRIDGPCGWENEGRRRYDPVLRRKRSLR